MLINAQISNILDNLNFLTNCSIILSGAHMRRASAELAERRRASFGSKGEKQKSQRELNLNNNLCFSGTSSWWNFRPAPCCNSIQRFTWGKFSELPQRMVWKKSDYVRFIEKWMENFSVKIPLVSQILIIALSHGWTNRSFSYWLIVCFVSCSTAP